MEQNSCCGRPCLLFRSIMVLFYSQWFRMRFARKKVPFILVLFFIFCARAGASQLEIERINLFPKRYERFDEDISILIKLCNFYKKEQPIHIDWVPGRMYTFFEFAGSLPSVPQLIGPFHKRFDMPPLLLRKNECIKKVFNLKEVYFFKAAGAYRFRILYSSCGWKVKKECGLLFSNWLTAHIFSSSARSLPQFGPKTPFHAKPKTPNPKNDTKSP